MYVCMYVCMYVDIRNAMKEYGVTTIHPIMPYLIYLEFFEVY